MVIERYIGSYEGRHGSLVIAIGGMHGNEMAGVSALQHLFKMLKKEPIVNPGFEFRGRLIGLVGNLIAIRENKRFIDVDLNRQWTIDHVAEVLQMSKEALNSEEKEVIELYQIIQKEITQYQPNKVILLDLHTTSAEDGIFSIPTVSEESIALAKGLLAPVITELTRNLKGTIMQFFDDTNLGVPVVAVSFESGQHNDALSINRSIAAIVNCLRFEGLVKSADVESRHDEILRSKTEYLPKIARLAYKHPFKVEEQFIMAPGFRNFTRVKKGDYLADDINGKITAPMTGYILMPLYQKQGSEGFFIVVE